MRTRGRKVLGKCKSKTCPLCSIRRTIPVPCVVCTIRQDAYVKSSIQHQLASLTSFKSQPSLGCTNIILHLMQLKPRICESVNLDTCQGLRAEVPRLHGHTTPSTASEFLTKSMVPLTPSLIDGYIHPLHLGTEVAALHLMINSALS